MSFAGKVKEELLSLANRDKNELSAMIKMSSRTGGVFCRVWADLHE